MADVPSEPQAVGVGLRIATAATTCLLISEVLHLEMEFLGVYTCHLVMVQYPFSAFQKGLERLGGRALGVLYGLVLVLFLRDTPLLFLVLMLLGQLLFFYIYASGRFAYAALMGGLFLGVEAAIGITAPHTALPYAWHLIQQLFLALCVIYAVNWITGAERTLDIDPSGEPLWPVRPDWLNQSAMVSTAQIGALFLTIILDLPVLPTMISAAILGITTTTRPALEKKAVQRVLGALLGGGYAMAAMFLLALMPYFPLLLLLVFVGMFLSAYYTKVSVNNSYGFMQMGLVLPMVLIGSAGEIGSMHTAEQRLIGVAAGLAVVEVVFLCWPPM